jgi:hypothetical protein
VPTLAELIDASLVTESRVTAAEIRAATADPLFQTGVPRAMVSGNDVSYGVFRMFQLISHEPPSTQVFRDRVEAERWLERQRGQSFG